jgi:hypothetical protein
MQIPEAGETTRQEKWGRARMKEKLKKRENPTQNTANWTA